MIRRHLPNYKKKKTRLAKAQDKFNRSVEKTVLDNIKMSGDVFFNEHAPTLPLLRALVSLGKEESDFIMWTPEVLFSAIDRKHGLWSNERVSKALLAYHEKGSIDTEVPELVRQKIYALRILVSSDVAYNDWHIFEKVGCVFNDRLAHFGVVEKLSPLECAKTIAIMDAVRPDEISHEVKAYVAGSAHLEGFYTLGPCTWLKLSDEILREMNRAATGLEFSTSLELKIKESFNELTQTKSLKNPESFEGLQALRLYACEISGKDGYNGEYVL